MKNFKEIAEKCLAGELSGTFKLASGQLISSDNLKRRPIDPSCTHQYEMYVDGMQLFYTIYGTLYSLRSDSLDIIDFIPDNMKEQIKIDIPEGMEAIQEETPDGLKIKFIKKSLSYKDIENKLSLHTKLQTQYFWNSNVNECYFSKKVEVLRKLTNIRNYFGGDKPTNSWIITIDSALRPFVIKNSKSYRETCFIYFDTKEHAQAAINMLGDELKYLFEPW